MTSMMASADLTAADGDEQLGRHGQMTEVYTIHFHSVVIEVVTVAVVYLIVVAAAAAVEVAVLVVCCGV